jgi:hypothetical protein
MPLVPDPPYELSFPASGQCMSDTRVRGESRRSTRVAFKIVISVQSLRESLTCDGETLVVNRHGALISSSIPLRIEMKIRIQVVLTGMRADAKEL